MHWIFCNELGKICHYAACFPCITWAFRSCSIYFSSGRHVQEQIQENPTLKIPVPKRGQQPPINHSISATELLGLTINMVCSTEVSKNCNRQESWPTSRPVFSLLVPAIPPGKGWFMAILHSNYSHWFIMAPLTNSATLPAAGPDTLELGQSAKHFCLRETLWNEMSRDTC